MAGFLSRRARREVHAEPADPTLRKFLWCRREARAAIRELEVAEARHELNGRELRSLDRAREIVAGREPPPRASTARPEPA